MKIPRLFTAVLLASSFAVAASSASDWTSFRGPSSTGAGDQVDLPAKWTADAFLWKTKLPGPGTATPITVGNKVFVTCYTGYGTDIVASKGFDLLGAFAKDQKGANPGQPQKQQDKGQGGKGFDPSQFQKQFGKGKGGQGFPQFGKGGFGGLGGAGNSAEQKNLRFLMLCFDATTGKQFWKLDIEPKLPEASFSGFLRDHGYTSSSPVTDGERVYVFFGKTGVLAVDMQGKKLWQVDVGSNVHMYGTAASLVLYKNLVIVNAGIESNSLIGIDKTTGKEVWRVKGISGNWTTPIIVQSKEKKHELVLPLTDKITGYDPETGKELWYCEGPATGKGQAGFSYGYSTLFATAVAKDDVVFACESGGISTQATTIAVRAGGRGNVSKTHILWRQKAGTQFNSPAVSGDYLYCFNGMAVCMRTDTGKVVYKERLSDGPEYPSPIITGDKIVALTRMDGLFVVAAGGKFRAVTHQKFESDNSVFNASPAVSDGRLFVRSNAYLYCIGKKAAP